MKGYAPPPGSIPTLEVPDLAGVRSAHLIGVGGAGMSGIARLLLARGLVVSGSDLKESAGLAMLRGLGATITVGHGADNLGSPDAVVVSTAIPAGNPEVRAARDRRIPVLARAQVLAALTRGFRTVAVAGTHGKTTTTSMLAVILERTGVDPTYVIGGDLNESGSNARSGRGDVFLAEADESDGSFLLLAPEVAVVTNVEADHLDFYRDRDEVEEAFEVFCRRAQRVIACADDGGAARVAAKAGVPVVGYGESEEADARVEDVVVTREGSRCRVRFSDVVVDVTVRLPGRHYLLNAAGALAAAREVGVDPEEGARALAGLTGVRRRFERLGSARGAEFVDDYAHHPTEVEAVLAAARAGGSGGVARQELESRGRDGERTPRMEGRALRIVVVFQPHRYSRTEALWRELGESLGAADVVVVTDVFAAGELAVPGISGKLVVDALVENAPGKRAVYLPSRADIAPFLAREVREGDLVLTLGAGDVTMVGDETLARLREEDA